MPALSCREAALQAGGIYPDKKNNMESPEQEQQPDRKEPFDLGMLQFFVKIGRTLFIGFFWMLVNVFLGLYLGFAVPEESTPGRMIFFYSWFVISLGAYLYLVWRMWKRPKETEDGGDSPGL